MERVFNVPLFLCPVWKDLCTNKVELQLLILRRTFSDFFLFSELSMKGKGSDIIPVRCVFELTR